MLKLKQQQTIVPSKKLKLTLERLILHEGLTKLAIIDEFPFLDKFRFECVWQVICTLTLHQIFNLCGSIPRRSAA